MATHASILAWRIPWIEESGGLQSMGSQSQTRLKRLSMHACTVQSKHLFFKPRMSRNKNKSSSDIAGIAKKHQLLLLYYYTF